MSSLPADERDETTWCRAHLRDPSRRRRCVRGRPDEVRDDLTPAAASPWSQSGSLAPLVLFLALAKGIRHREVADDERAGEEHRRRYEAHLAAPALPDVDRRPSRRRSSPFPTSIVAGSFTRAFDRSAALLRA